MLEKIFCKEKILKITSTILLILWMMTVFIFSSQDGKETIATIDNFIYSLENTLNKGPKVQNNNNSKTDNEETQKYKHSKELQRFVRKNAHYFLYMVGGVVLSVFFYAFLPNNKCRKYILCAIISGVLYAFSDEFHQKFVSGRTSSLIDVGIDSLGILTGTILFISFITVIKNLRKNKIKLKLGE